MPLKERRRAVSALVTIVFSIFILVAPLVAIAIAQATPQITLWNPSSFSADQTTPIVVSDADTGDDEAEDILETTYRLMATSQNTPAQGLVEFELSQSDLVNITLGEATKVGADGWEFHWDMDDPTPIADGEYTLRAILYSGSGVTAVEVARDELAVLVRNGVPAPPTESPSADIASITNGDQVGFYTHPISGTSATVFTAEYSAGTTFIEAFYTVSDPGDTPEWKSCAGPSNVGSSNDAPAGSIQFRCILDAEDQGGSTVTGLGVVANESPSDPIAGGERDVNFNAGSDAIRIVPYAQDATSVTIDEPTVRTDGGPTTCSPNQFVTVLDQLGKPISSINVDVHARGPSDQLRFRVAGFLASAPSGNKAPDKAHGGVERAYACGDVSQDFAGSQGDHNVPGGPDIKHIESTGGTSTAGRFGIGMKTDRNGSTQITFWVDEDDDDLFCDDEPFVHASIGWNQPAPAPGGEAPTVTDCPIPDPPGGSTSPTGPSGECTVEGTSGSDNLVGSQGNDVICGGGGDDTIDGRGGDDIIRGEAGNDLLEGGVGDDTIDGGAGNDRASGGDGNDLIDGFAGIDVLSGGPGDDTLRGSAGIDGFRGGPNNDVIQAGSGNDVANGEGGNDIFKGFNGKDRADGGGGKDTLRGMGQNDRLLGGGGNDRLIGGKGRDRCSGGPGRNKVKQCER